MAITALFLAGFLFLVGCEEAKPPAEHPHPHGGPKLVFHEHRVENRSVVGHVGDPAEDHGWGHPHLHYEGYDLLHNHSPNTPGHKAPASWRIGFDYDPGTVEYTRGDTIEPYTFAPPVRTVSGRYTGLFKDPEKIDLLGLSVTGTTVSGTLIASGVHGIEYEVTDTLTRETAKATLTLDIEAAPPAPPPPPVTTPPPSPPPSPAPPEGPTYSWHTLDHDVGMYPHGGQYLARDCCVEEIGTLTLKSIASVYGIVWGSGLVSCPVNRYANGICVEYTLTRDSPDSPPHLDGPFPQPVPAVLSGRSWCTTDVDEIDEDVQHWWMGSDTSLMCMGPGRTVMGASSYPLTPACNQ